MAKNEGEKNTQAGDGTVIGDGAPDGGPGAEAGADYDAAYAHAEAGRIAQADAICRKILTPDPTHAEALQLQGAIAAKSGNISSAIEFFNRALAGPQSSQGYFATGSPAFRRAFNQLTRGLDQNPIR